MTAQEAVDYSLVPVRWILWILALPINILTFIITRVRTRMYDPEELVCPACGFRGDSGTGGKSCVVRFTRTIGSERAAIQHICFRCGCDEIFTRLYSPANRWLPEYKADQVAKIKEASAKEAL